MDGTPRSITVCDHGAGLLGSGFLPRLGFYRKAAAQPARPRAGQKPVREAREGREDLIGLRGEQDPRRSP